MTTPVQIGRFQRVLRILSHLQSGPRSNTTRLAEEFHVSRRTIHRDIKLLQAAEIPVFFDEEADVYRLAAEYRFTRPPAMTSKEVGLLALAANLSLPMMASKNEGTVRDAVSKLVSTFPSETRVEVGNLLACCCVEIPGIQDNGLNGEVVQAVLKAIRKRRQIRITFVDKTLDDTSTKVAPYRVVITENSWLLMGRSSVDRQTKTFNLDLIEKAELTEDSFTIPKGFRCKNYLPDQVPNPCVKPHFQKIGSLVPDDCDE